MYVHCGWSTSLAGPSVPGEQGVSLPTGMLLPQGCSPTHGVACVTATAVLCDGITVFADGFVLVLLSAEKASPDSGGPWAGRALQLERAYPEVICLNDTRSQKESVATKRMWLYKRTTHTMGNHGHAVVSVGSTSSTRTTAVGTANDIIIIIINYMY